MSTGEIFPNPTVKTVIVQVRYPNLFYVEGRMGDFQVKVMREFPDSSLLYRRSVLMADIGPEGKIEKIPGQEEVVGKKIWQFRSEKGYLVDVMTDNLTISSQYHKTYNLGEKDRFRDIVKLVLDAFLETMTIPIINRIGLRYIDECPVPSKENSTFRSWYNSSFPIDRFSIEDAKEMSFFAITKRKEYMLRYGEYLKPTEKGNYILTLDFDGQAGRTDAKDYLQVLDSLHEIISDEYQITIKEPVKDYMRRKEDGPR